MNNDILQNARIAAYFIWEYTHCNDALDLWYCAEDIASFFERSGIEHFNEIKETVNSGFDNSSYINFVRQIAFRLYVYTKNPSPIDNWFAAERLLDNREWCTVILTMAREFRAYKKGEGDLSGIRSGMIRQYYTI